MQQLSNIDINGLFSYSVIRLLIMLIITSILVIYFIFLVRKNNKKEKKTTIPPIIIKNIYLTKIDNLINMYKEEKISNRKAYQKLSSLIRHFIYEVTGIKLQNCTLEDIKEKDLPVIYELVKEYYSPEFARTSAGNFINSITKTKEVIEKWN